MFSTDQFMHFVNLVVYMCIFVFLYDYLRVEKIHLNFIAREIPSSWTDEYFIA